MSSDTEKALESKDLQGYPSLAAFIASDNEHSTAIYKRFDRLSSRNLLYYQSELAELEAKQEDLDRRIIDKCLDTEDGVDIQRPARSWNFLINAASADDESLAAEQLKLAMEIRRMLREYGEAIKLDSEMLSFRPPSKQTYQAFCNQFKNVEAGVGDFPTLVGRSATVYDRRTQTMALVRPQEEDRLTSFFRKYCPRLFMTRRPADPDTSTSSSIAYVSAKRISFVVSLINILLCCTFLFGSIYNLYYTRTDQVKLGLIAGYTIAFASCISLVSNAKRSEIFGACAAYAAVLVVFVSGNLGNGNTQSSGGV